jgi:L-alanine-DL-glutamate epimerase-like enolase superfamily enzyme
MAVAPASGSVVERVTLSAYTIPTDAPEADGTYSWDSTTLVVCEATAGGVRGLGYGYADTATAQLAQNLLVPTVIGRDVLDVTASWVAMCGAVRNLGRPGVCAMAISAVDTALWDLKARLLKLPLVKLLGQVRESAPVYGSGGFTTYSNTRLQEQLGGWAKQGIPRVKMKIGTHPGQDVARVRAAREAIGDRVALFVDANGAYSRKQALYYADQFAKLGVTWFEEPISSDDLHGLRLIRDRGPTGMDIAAGEYGYDLWYFRRMLSAGAVDVQQADATRCGGFTGFLQVGSLCAAHHLPLSSHCAPALHLHPCCATTADFRHMEYFHDHVRIESILFDGTASPVEGALRPDLSRPGMGLEFKRQDAERYRVWAAE